MAGKYVELTNPGYSSLFTRDLTFTPNGNAGEAASLDAFDPDSAAPLHEGEWLEMGAGGTFTRGSAVETVTVAAAALQVALVQANNDAGVGTSPAFLYFQERGRYDAQVTKKAHCIVGPHGYEFRTKQIVAAANDPIGDPVLVCWGVTPAGNRIRCLATRTAINATGDTIVAGDWIAGHVTRVHGANDCSVQLAPSFDQG